MKADNTVAMTILSQLGGSNKLKAMIGANRFDYSENSLNFMFCRNPGKYKGVTITLNANDLYDIKFYRQKNAPSFEVTFTEFKDVYAENLVEIFENETGLVMGGIK